MARRGNKDRGIVFKDGAWWVRLYVNGQEKWHRVDNKSQARAVYSRIKTEQREGRYFPEKFDRKQDLTLRAWVKRCLEDMTSPGLRNMHHYGKFWSKLLGQRLLAKISADDLRHVQSRMVAKATRSPHTINRYFAALRRFLNLAIAEGFLPTNPVKGVKFFPEPTGRLRFLTDAEIALLREELPPEHWSLVAFSLETGLRLSEQFHARWDCINMEQGILTIPLSKSGKTRHVILSEAALTILKNLSTRSYSPYLFPSPLNAGQPMQGRNFAVKVYEPALRRAGIEGVTWHTLRHTFASRAVMAGVDIRSVQELMGHSTITMTMRYTHLSPTHLRTAVNKASLGLMASKTGSGTGSKTGSNANVVISGEPSRMAEVAKISAGLIGGAERGRTAASQFCRLLP